MYVTPASLIAYNWIKRYNVQAADMNAFQTSLFANERGMFEGLVGAAVLEGFAISISAMQVIAGSGIAVGPSGYLDVLPASGAVNIVAPATGTTRSLVVIQPNVVTGTVIQDPINPNVTDVLTQVQQATLAVIAGVAATSPVYPAVPAGATVLCGVRATAGQVALAASDIDLSVQDTVGKNGYFNHITGLNDDRIRPYRNSNQSLGVKPSQTVSPTPQSFTYVTPGVPSIFPKASGLFAAADTFLNFQTGAISGGDTTSPAFTPTIPTAGNAIVAAVGLNINDTLTVKYGTQGTRAQCFAAITNQTTVGAGALSLPSAKLIAFVVLYSSDGANITELDFVDARSFSAFVASSAYPGYDIVVGGSGVIGATHATLAAAIADSATGNNERVLLADSQTLANVAVTLTKAGWSIDALPGVTYTASGTGSTLTFEALRLQINRLRLANFASAITFNSSGGYARIRDCYFNSCSVNVDTTGAPTGTQFPVEEGSISE